MITGLHHVSVATSDMERSVAFYVGMLGLKPCPAKANWLSAGEGYAVHLMPCRSGPVPIDPARHLAFEVQSLESVVALLLQHGLRPYQVPVDQAARHPILSADDPLTFGIGTVFIEDPDGNSVEFVQAGRGIIGEILGEPTRSRNAAA